MSVNYYCIIHGLLTRNYTCPYAKRTLAIDVNARVGWYVFLRGRFLNTLTVKEKPLKFYSMFARYIYYVMYTEYIVVHILLYENI